MKFLLALFLVTNFSNQNCEGQYLKLINALKQADSIILVSHQITYGYMVIKPGAAKKDLPLILNGNINPRIIIKKSQLKNNEKNKLINIFKMPLHIAEYTPTKCDEPHNSILIYKKEKLAYVDICFSCQHAHLSKIFLHGDFDELILVQKQWTLLEKFFNKFHLAYKGFE